MNIVRSLVAASLLFAIFYSVGHAADAKKHKVVFVTGDEEYRSEESMPMLAKILARDFPNISCHVCYSLNDQGEIDPNRTNSISGLEALDDADLMVLFTRFRDLPADQFQHILSYLDKGKPVVGFRTATHAFKFKEESKFVAWNDQKIGELVGQKWITHHGHFGDGFEILTKTEIIPEQSQHPILRGVKGFDAFSWLYHVEGGGDKLSGNAVPLMRGTSLKSGHAKETDRFPLTQPTAWIKSHAGKDGQVGRVFFSTTAHPFDFKDPSMRKLALNGILWALEQEDQIPLDGCSADPVGNYDPNNSGFGDKYKKGVKPE